MNNTRNVLDMTKAFITQQLLQDSEIPKADQIDLLNRSVNYFKENTEYDRGSFAREMFQNEEVAGSFERFAISDEAGARVQERAQARQGLPHLHPRRP